jgi:hypothetical protein
MSRTQHVSLLHTLQAAPDIHFIAEGHQRCGEPPQGTTPVINEE